MTIDDTVNLFIRNAENADAHVVLVGDEAALNQVLSDILAETDAVYCPGVSELEKALVIPPARRSESYFQASVCVEEVRGAIAETGSLICTSQDGKAVQASLLPSHHVAVVRAGNVYASLDDYFASCGDSPPTNITLVTGPSRTADIELTLTIGVHGPERLTVIVV